MTKIRENKQTILLVPGAMTGEWIWEDNFIVDFQSAGYQVKTMSFSGHGANLAKRLQLKFSDYVDECVAAINACSKPPIVIGHSLGGVVALHAASKTEVASMILLSPVPYHGMLGSIVSLASVSPVSLLKFSAALIDARVTQFGSPPLGIYSDTCDQEKSQRITKNLKSESIPVLLRLLSPPKLDIEALDPDKILFVAATGDYIIPHKEVIKAAEALGSPYTLYEGLCHSYQAEESSSEIASDLISFIQEIDQSRRVSVAA